LMRFPTIVGWTVICKNLSKYLWIYSWKPIFLSLGYCSRIIAVLAKRRSHDSMLHPLSNREIDSYTLRNFRVDYRVRRSIISSCRYFLLLFAIGLFSPQDQRRKNPELIYSILAFWEIFTTNLCFIDPTYLSQYLIDSPLIQELFQVFWWKMLD
jgi:hypothetical protein